MELYTTQPWTLGIKTSVSYCYKRSKGSLADHRMRYNTTDLVRIVLIWGLWFGLVHADAPARTALFWGDTHLHTTNSIDAYFLGNMTTTPEIAYRFAMGLPVIHPGTKARFQLERPLDFLVVADHGEYLGIAAKLGAGDPLVAGTESGRRYIQMLEEGRRAAIYDDLAIDFRIRKPKADLVSEKIMQTAWAESIDAAEKYNTPGRFTTFIGWEWTSETGGPNLHRVIFTPQGARVAKEFMPFTIFDSDRPEDLWNWLEEMGRRTGAEFIAIPHNPNISRGKMFDRVDSDGEPITSTYALTRVRWEPIVEVTQIKGDSETHPILSPTDEFAAFERYEVPFSYGIKGEPQRTTFTEGDYLRGALRRGLEIGTSIGVNPYKVGMIGSTDSHTGLSTVDEKSFGGKMATNSTPEAQLNDVIPGATGFYMSAQGLAGIWAEENTRASLFAAFKRKEVYATTGPRISLRFFGGFDFRPGNLEARDIASVGYKKGVPMGGDLNTAPEGKRPSFLVRAIKDPLGANLDCIQIIKGWVDDLGHSHERIFNVVASDQREIIQNVLPPVGNSVNLETGKSTNSIGDPELQAVWTDPEFNSKEPCFYYVRVLEIPTARHSLYDAVALGLDPVVTGRPATIQERAYSSPIWYSP